MEKIEIEKFDKIRNEMEIVYKFDNRPWIIGYSGGKDSTMLIKLVFQMVMNLKKEDRKKKIFIVTSDTMVENPIVENHMNNSSKCINQSSMSTGLGIKSVIITPDIAQSFWSMVIGLGYPTPEPPGFRWCTDKLKIIPMNKFTNSIIKEFGEVVLLLGVRKSESISRQRSIERREILGKILTPHNDIEKAYVYNPLTAIPNETVWEFLLENDGLSEWGADMNYLYKLYRGENLPEEQSVVGEIDKDKLAVTGNSRFGCWCCTIVKEDKSLQNFINGGSVELIPLRELRNWLVSIRHDANYRDKKRRNGAVYKKANGDIGLGPFTLNARAIILKRLLEVQRDLNENYANCRDLELISIDELKYIDTLWEQEGDLSRRMLVDIYSDVMNKLLPWDSYKSSLYTEDVVEILKNAAEKEGIPFELISKLITSIEKNKHFVKGNKVQKEFDKIMAQGWLHDAVIKEALNNEDK